MKVKVSIVTVVYNDKHNIEGTILSVLSQKYDNYEYVIIDGGSSDGTWKIIQTYRDRIFFSISEKDAGIYDAMNKSISKCSGDYVIFMNSGDRFSKDSVLFEIFNKEVTEDVVYGDSLYYYNDKPILIKGKSFHELKYQMPFNHQAVFTKRVLLSQTPFNTGYRYAADYNLFHNLYISGCSFRYIPICVSEYYLEGGATYTNMVSCYREVASISNVNDFKSTLIKIHVYLAHFYYKILPQKCLNYIRMMIYGIQK